LKRLILKPYLLALLYWKEFYLDRRTWVDWNLSPEQIRDLQSLRASPGWKVLSEKLEILEEEAKESLVNAERMEDFLRRKGFLEGISQVPVFFQNLFLVREGDNQASIIERWLDRQISKISPDEELRFLTR